VALDIPTLSTERLTLRPFREEDHVALHDLMQDPEVVHFINEDRRPTLPEAWRMVSGWLGHWALRGYGAWAVEERASGVLVGRIGFINPVGWPGLELGYMLGRPYWGRGYATEGGIAALDWGFGVQGFERVISLIDPLNNASIAVATRLGEVHVGEAELLGHQLRIYAIDRAAWEAGGAG